MRNLNQFRALVCVILVSLSVSANSQGFERASNGSVLNRLVAGEQQAQTSLSEPSVLDRQIGMKKDASGRISEFVDKNGARSVISYDGRGRVYAVAHPTEQRIVLFHYLPGAIDPDKPNAMSLIDTATGMELKYVSLQTTGQKYLSPDDPEFQDLLNLIWTTEDPFNWDIYYNWGVLPLDPNQCTLQACNDSCDTLLGMTGVACAAVGVATGPGGVLCGAVGLAAWAHCRQSCTFGCR